MATVAPPERAPWRWSSRRRARLLGGGAFYLACAALAVVFLAPLAWSMLTSLKPAAEIVRTSPSWLPERLTLENYRGLDEVGSGILRYVANSLLTVAYTLVGTIVLSTLGGYGFARFAFPAKNLLFVLVLAPLMIPFQAIMVPLFLVLRELHLNNTLFGLAMVYVTAQLPFGIFVMRNAFASIPREIEEAALLDGCSALRMLFRMMLPLVMPGLVTIGLFAFFNAWNELYAALIYLSDDDKYTLPLLLAQARTNPGLFGGTNWGGLQASVTISMLPCLLLFVLLQRYYVSGLASGAVK
ncbi:MAG: carbohydrate ABC transporter permease [Chloroflexota bacterium]|nr:carbohydrate ABC transporter permease [Chloroflexota bacterium]